MIAGNTVLGSEPISTSHWSQLTPTLQRFATLDAQLECDVAVIGGGYTGLLSALTLAAAGRRVVLVEAEQPGWGASGRNAGQVIPMAWGGHKTAGFITSKQGAERARRLNTAVAAAGRTLFDLIDEHQIQCDAHTGYVCVTRTDKTRVEIGRAHV